MALIKPWIIVTQRFETVPIVITTSNFNCMPSNLIILRKYVKFNNPLFYTLFKTTQIILFSLQQCNIPKKKMVSSIASHKSMYVIISSSRIFSISLPNYRHFISAGWYISDVRRAIYNDIVVYSDGLEIRTTPSIACRTGK